ncbi:MAG: molecular chaperone TorD family protein [Mariniblastus sp.]
MSSDDQNVNLNPAEVLVTQPTAPQSELVAYEIASQANAFGLLARLWVSEIDQDLLDELLSDPVGPAYVAAGGVLPSIDSEGSDSEMSLLENLAVEYCGCFLGPKNHLPPHQSVVAHSRFQGDCLDSLKKYIEVIGQPKGIFSDQKMLDHAGVLFHMMQRVLASLAEAIEDESSPETTKQSLVHLRDSFYVEHLDWLIGYCNVAEGKSQSEFYSGLFRLTKSLLSEANFVGDFS